jgi:hypothetical protein
MWKMCENLPLPSFTSNNAGITEQFSNSSYDVIIPDTFKDKISQYLIDNRFKTKALYNAFLELSSIKAQLDDFRNQIRSVLNLTKMYNFIFKSNSNREWTIRRSHCAKPFPGGSTTLPNGKEQIFEGKLDELLSVSYFMIPRPKFQFSIFVFVGSVDTQLIHLLLDNYIVSRRSDACKL